MQADGTDAVQLKVKGQRILVCGGRNYANYHTIAAVLNELAPSEVCHGAAQGADSLAGQWAWVSGVPCQTFPANWNRQPDGSYDRSAGPKRNQKMLQEFKPDLVVAFAGGRGTAHMMKIARAAGVPVLEYP